MLGDVYSDDEEEYLHDGHIPARYRQRNAARDSDGMLVVKLFS